MPAPGPSLSGVNPDYFFSGTFRPGRGLFSGDFGPTGLWLWSMPGLCSQLSGLDADYMIAANTDGDMEDEIIGDFGATGPVALRGRPVDRFRLHLDHSERGERRFHDPGRLRRERDRRGSRRTSGPPDSGSGIPAPGVRYRASTRSTLMAADVDGDGADEILADFATFGPWWLRPMDVEFGHLEPSQRPQSRLV